jgi:hypothetical protein
VWAADPALVFGELHRGGPHGVVERAHELVLEEWGSSQGDELRLPQPGLKQTTPRPLEDSARLRSYAGGGATGAQVAARERNSSDAFSFSFSFIGTSSSNRSGGRIRIASPISQRVPSPCRA